jgi:acetolactate synthase-1/3 small subunit
MAIPRSPLAQHEEELDVKDAEDVVDASALPPG